MENYTLVALILLSIIFTIILHLFKQSQKFSKSKQLPPGPKPWPIIGNLHLLGDNPHQSVAQLAKIHGPLMSLKLGNITTIVISSPEIAKEMFEKHDFNFAGRKVPDAAGAGDHNQFSMVWLPICSKWRLLWKISAVQLFTNQRLDASHGLRRKKVDELVDYARNCCEKGVAIDIGKAGFTTSLNLLSNTFFSIDLSSYGSSISREFKELFSIMLEDGGNPNISDFFPLVKHLDLQGIRRRITGHFEKMMRVFEEIIDERLRDEMDAKDDVLSTLLKLVKESELSLDDVKHLLMDLFIAGTDTTSSTLEWAMTELLRNPEKIEKTQAEIDQVVGKSGPIHESDIPKLSYIQAVVKETLRLHPPAPFLLPHKTEKDVDFAAILCPKMHKFGLMYGRLVMIQMYGQARIHLNLKDFWKSTLI